MVSGERVGGRLAGLVGGRVGIVLDIFNMVSCDEGSPKDIMFLGRGGLQERERGRKRMKFQSIKLKFFFSPHTKVAVTTKRLTHKATTISSN